LLSWQRVADAWEIASEEGVIRVVIEDECLVVKNVDAEYLWSVDLS
jgi:hypothetical protein